MADYLIASGGHSTKSHEHIWWWKSESLGYTICVDKAGRYSEDEAQAICASSSCLAVPIGVAVEMARTTPFYRRSDGTLNKLYDGGPHRPVENSRESWKALKAAAFACGPYVKPTPMPQSKRRAIYLEGAPDAQ